MFFGPKAAPMIDPSDALPGRTLPMAVAAAHAVLGTSMTPPFPDGVEVVHLGMGCFWGAERAMWQIPGVWTTAVGYAGGFTPNPTYEEVCSGRTGHAEVVLVAHDPAVVPLTTILRTFWEGHDPTQGMRQGNDVGTQYRSCLYWTDDVQRDAIESSRALFGARLAAAGHPGVTTEVAPATTFFYAEDAHQQYLHKVPNGYCGMGGTGVTCPIGLDGG